MRLLTLAFALSIASFACNSNDSSPPVAGPIDGTYVQDSDTCDGTPQSGAAGATLTIANTSWTYVLPAKVDGCVVTEHTTATYSNGSLSTVQNSKACSASCSTGECMANTTDQPTCTGTYSLTGTSLNVTLSNQDCNGAGCISNKTDVNLLTKQ